MATVREKSKQLAETTRLLTASGRRRERDQRAIAKVTGGRMDEEPEENKDRFHNFYRCSECGEEWEDYWSCACDDRCPKCNTEIEPYKYEEKDEEGNYHE